MPGVGSKITTKPAPFGAGLVVELSPKPIIRPLPRPLGAGLVISETALKVKPVPRPVGAGLVVSFSPVSKFKAKPGALGAGLCIEHQGAAGIRSSALLPYLLGAGIAVHFTDPIDYDETNRMTAAAFRDKDFTRLSDVKQLFKNLRYLVNQFGADHSLTTGEHTPKPLSNFAGFTKVTGFAADPVPPKLGDTRIHLIETPGITPTSTGLMYVIVGQSVDGIFEAVPAYGGDLAFKFFALVKKVAVKGTGT